MRSFLVVAVACLLVGACGGAGSSSAGDADLDSVAAEVCGLLTGYVNEVAAATDRLDAAVQAEPAAALGPFETWAGELVAASDRLGPAVDDLELPEDERGDRLRGDLEQGAAEAAETAARLQDELPGVLAEQDSTSARMSVLLVDAERLFSVVEPEVDAQGGPLDQALLAEPTCRHVTEP